DDLDQATMDEMKQFPGRIADSLHHFRFREGLTGMMNLARLGNKYLTDSEPWKLFEADPGRVGTILNTSLQICAQLSIVAEPFLPFTAAKIRRMLNLPDYTWNDATLLNWLTAGHRLNKAELLFQKIDDKTIGTQIQKLHATRDVQPPFMAAQAGDSPAVQPPFMAALPEILYDDFTKLDIRAGTILEVEIVPNTDKLLKLKVDTGIDRRTVVSGIAQYFKPEEIIGKRVSILVNLAPRKLRGIESQGMILMAENPDGSLYFISPDDGTINGAVVR
ncbi:MAG: methionine--tRNA ligase subunit beta, partial [Bacteroidetes bacterium]